MYSPGGPAQCSVMTWDGAGWEEGSEDRDACIGIAGSHCLQQKPTLHCKAITVQLKVNLKRLKHNILSNDFLKPCIYQGQQMLVSHPHLFSTLVLV